MKEKPITVYTVPLTSDQAVRLKQMLADSGFKFEPKPYTLYYGTKPKLNVAVYEKGPKAVIQGRETEDFVKFHLEPEILGEARLGYDEVLHPDRFEPHFGIDESGKGDFFGPLVVAGAYVDGDIARSFLKAGITDSKKIGTDVRIRDLATIIRNTPGVTYKIIEIGPLKYNQLYRKIGNLNRLLAWAHAKVIEELATARPECPRALSDQFANPSLIKRALQERGRALNLEQRTKAESDPAVAAASILARERFIDWIDNTGRSHGVILPKGASKQVRETAAKLAAAHSPEILESLAKTHFKTASEIDPVRFPPKPENPAFL